jgi:hypothetical protein
MRKVFPIATLILFAIFVAYAFAQEAPVEGPPRDVKIADKTFKAGTVVDGHFSIMEFKRQPAKDRRGDPIRYYLEMSKPTGASIGAWGALHDPYPDGMAYLDGKPYPPNNPGKGDLYLQYTPFGGAEGWIIEKPAAGFAIALKHGKKNHQTLGQTFIAPEEFKALAFGTPTWTAAGGFTLTLYRAGEEQQSVEPNGKLATTWAHLKKGYLD